MNFNGDKPFYRCIIPHEQFCSGKSHLLRSHQTQTTQPAHRVKSVTTQYLWYPTPNRDRTLMWLIPVTWTPSSSISTTPCVRFMQLSIPFLISCRAKRLLSTSWSEHSDSKQPIMQCDFVAQFQKRFCLITQNSKCRHMVRIYIYISGYLVALHAISDVPNNLQGIHNWIECI